MIHQLLRLDKSDAISLAKRILTSKSIDKPNLDIELLGVTKVLPVSWQREWALSTLRRNLPAIEVRKLVAHSKRKKLRSSFATFAKFSQISTELQELDFLPVTLVGRGITLNVEFYGAKYMTFATDSHDDEKFPLQVYLGEINLDVEDILALKRGVEIECPLPDLLHAKLFSYGALVGSASIKILNGKIHLTVTQLSSKQSDN